MYYLLCTYPFDALVRNLSLQYIATCTCVIMYIRDHVIMYVTNYGGKFEEGMCDWPWVLEN